VSGHCGGLDQTGGRLPPPGQLFAAPSRRALGDELRRLSAVGAAFSTNPHESGNHTGTKTDGGRGDGPAPAPDERNVYHAIGPSEPAARVVGPAPAERPRERGERPPTTRQRVAHPRAPCSLPVHGGGLREQARGTPADRSTISCGTCAVLPATRPAPPTSDHAVGARAAYGRLCVAELRRGSRSVWPPTRAGAKMRSGRRRQGDRTGRAYSSRPHTGCWYPNQPQPLARRRWSSYHSDKTGRLPTRSRKRTPPHRRDSARNTSGDASGLKTYHQTNFRKIKEKNLTQAYDHTCVGQFGVACGGGPGPRRRVGLSGVIRSDVRSLPNRRTQLPPVPLARSRADAQATRRGLVTPSTQRGPRRSRSRGHAGYEATHSGRARPPSARCPRVTPGQTTPRGVRRESMLPGRLRMCRVHRSSPYASVAVRRSYRAWRNADQPEQHPKPVLPLAHPRPVGVGPRKQPYGASRLPCVRPPPGLA